MLMASQILIMLTIGFLIYAIDRRKESIPVPVLLVIIGMLLAFIPGFPPFELTADFLYHWILPLLLFISAYQFPFKQLKNKAGIILTLSTAGIIMSVLLLALLLYAAGFTWVGLSFTGALFLAALLTPTDPVTVISILRGKSNKHHIAEVVEGESMINDGTSVVIFSMAAQLYLQDQAVSILSFVGDFFLVTIGGITVGLVLGFLSCKVIHYIKSHAEQVWMTVILAYGSFYAAEWLNVSGILATVVVGLLLSRELMVHEEEKELRHDLKSFWGTVEPILLSFIFLMIGIESVEFFSISEFPFVMTAFFFTVLVRGTVLTSTIKLVPKWRGNYSRSDLVMMTWGGVKGTVSKVLLLGVLAHVENDQLLSWAFMVILFSFLIQSMTFYPLHKKIEEKEN